MKEITDEDRLEFLRCILGGRRYCPSFADTDMHGFIEKLTQEVRSVEFKKQCWPALMISAAVRGVLDYSKITDKDPLSLVKEEIVLEELHREWRLEAKRAKGLFNISKQLSGNKFNTWSDQQLTEYMSVRFPWEEVQEVSPFKDLPGFADFMNGFKTA